MSQSDTTPAARPGNPYARQVAALRMELLQRCTPQRIGRIADKMMELAEEGDVSAAKLIFQYVLGKPAEAAHPDRLDIDEVHVFQQGACRKDVLLPALAGGMPADVSADFLRKMTPIMGDIACEKIRREMREQVAQREADEAGRPTVTKRSSTAQSAPEEDWSDAIPAEQGGDPFAASPAVRMPIPAVTKRPQTDQRAANR